MAPIRPDRLLQKSPLTISEEDNLKSPSGEGPLIDLFKLEKRKKDLKHKEKFEDDRTFGDSSSTEFCLKKGVKDSEFLCSTSTYPHFIYPYGTDEHDETIKRKKSECFFQKDLYGEPDGFEESPLQVEISSDCLCGSEQSSVPENRKSSSLQFMLPVQESQSVRGYVPDMNKNILENHSSMPEVVRCQNYEKGIDEGSKNSFMESESCAFFAQMTQTSSTQKRKKKKKKKKKVKTLKTQICLKASTKVKHRARPSSQANNSGAANFVRSPNTAFPSCQGNIAGQANQCGGGGGDGGEDEDNFKGDKATCPNGDFSKKKKKPKKKRDVEMQSISEERPSQDGTEVMDISDGRTTDNHLYNFPSLEDVENSHLLHSRYCRFQSCELPRCLEIKNLYQHLDQCRLQICAVCNSLQTVVNMKHAQCCPFTTGCTVPFCIHSRFRKRKKSAPRNPVLDISPDPYGPNQAFAGANVRENLNPNIWPAVQPVAQAIPVNPPVPTAYCDAQGTPENSAATRDVDGVFKFKQNGIFALLGEETFEEGINYQCSGKLGEGSNGSVHNIIVHKNAISDQSIALQWARKQTKYKVEQDEIMIMRILSQDKSSFVSYYAVTSSSGPGDNIFMSKCDGDLKQYIDSKPGQVIPPDEAKYFLHQIDTALQKMHGLSFNGRPTPIIHKDLKAQNCMIEGDGAVVKIGDLDAAMLLNTEKTQPGLKPQGTKIFVAPEVLNKEPHGPPADIYSFGIMALEMTVGIPNAGEDLQFKIKKLTSLDKGLGELVKKCTQVNPDLRPTALQILHDPIFVQLNDGII